MQIGIFQKKDEFSEQITNPKIISIIKNIFLKENLNYNEKFIERVTNFCEFYCNFDSLIVTGPSFSGKSTILKKICFNLLKILKKEKLLPDLNFSEFEHFNYKIYSQEQLIEIIFNLQNSNKTLLLDGNLNIKRELVENNLRISKQKIVFETDLLNNLSPDIFIQSAIIFFDKIVTYEIIMENWLENNIPQSLELSKEFITKILKKFLPILLQFLRKKKDDIFYFNENWALQNFFKIFGNFLDGYEQSKERKTVEILKEIVNVKKNSNKIEKKKKITKFLNISFFENESRLLNSQEFVNKWIEAFFLLSFAF